jgi:hypothetical protein
VDHDGTVATGMTGEERRGNARLRLEFWTAFKEYMTERSRVRCARPTSEDWMNHSAGLNGGSLFSVQRTRLGEIGVQFALDDTTSRTIFSYLESRRREIDGAFAPGLRWHDPEGSRTSLIEFRRSADTSVRADWPAHFAWLREQLEHFQDVLWPLVGRVPPVAQPRRWDESSFFAELEALNPTSAAPAGAILDWARRQMPDIYWGRGAQFGTCVPRLRLGNVRYQLFALTTGGTLVLRFVDLKNTEPFHDAANRLRVLRGLNEVRLMDLPAEVIDHRPALPLPMFAEAAVRGALLDTAETFVADCRAFFGRP